MERLENADLPEMEDVVDMIHNYHERDILLSAVVGSKSYSR